MSRANLTLLLAVARQLEPLLPEMLFVGGVVTALLLSDPAAPEARATVDVDVTVQVASYGQFQAFVARLATHGYRIDPYGHTGRFLGGGHILDVIPSEPVLGDTNRWYAPAFPHARTLTLDGLNLQVISAPFFLGTKFEAFDSRGRADPTGSKDWTDIVSVLDGRPEVLSEVQGSPADLQEYLAN
jgi:predicted nucleotidyltransferase